MLDLSGRQRGDCPEHVGFLLSFHVADAFHAHGSPFCLQASAHAKLLALRVAHVLDALETYVAQLKRPSRTPNAWSVDGEVWALARTGSGSGSEAEQKFRSFSVKSEQMTLVKTQHARPIRRKLTNIMARIRKLSWVHLESSGCAG